MVCVEGAVICVPNHSRDGLRLCLEPEVKCNGEDDCVNGIDEENCPLSLSPGLQALIAIVVIGVVVAVPVIYVVVKRKQRKPVIPLSLRPAVERIMPCCISNKEAERSSQQLTGLDRSNGSPNSTDKDGFSNVAFASTHSPPASSQNTYSVTGRPLNRFKQVAQANELERVPSYRDWQANRLQPPPHSTQETGFMGGDGRVDGRVNRHSGGRILHTVEMNSTAPEQYKRQAANNITYAPAAQRYSPRQHTPYAISSSDGRSNHEAKSHLQNTDSIRQPAWERHIASNPNQYQLGREGAAAPPDYASYATVSSAVPAHQLRQALEKVAVSAPYAGYDREDDPSHNTVV